MGDFRLYSNHHPVNHRILLKTSLRLGSIVGRWINGSLLDGGNVQTISQLLTAEHRLLPWQELAARLLSAPGVDDKAAPPAAAAGLGLAAAAAAGGAAGAAPSKRLTITPEEKKRQQEQRDRERAAKVRDRFRGNSGSPCVLWCAVVAGSCQPSGPRTTARNSSVAWRIPRCTCLPEQLSPLMPV